MDAVRVCPGTDSIVVIQIVNACVSSMCFELNLETERPIAVKFALC